jgi:hypothetical protein
MPTPIATKSPVDLLFRRQGGADIHAEVQVWVKKDQYLPTDRPVHRIRFTNPLVAQEAQSVPLSPGIYVCVLLGMAREALNGDYAVRLAVKNKAVFTQQGNANTGPAQGEIVNFRADFELQVTP